MNSMNLYHIDYVLFHKTNKGEITYFLDCFPLSNNGISNYGQW